MGAVSMTSDGVECVIMGAASMTSDGVCGYGCCFHDQ